MVTATDSGAPRRTADLTLPQQGRHLVYAIVLLLDCIACSPHDRQTVDDEYRLGLLAASEGRYADAVNHFSTVIVVDTDRAELLDARASAYTAQERFTEALADLNRAVSLDSTNSVYLSNRAQALRRFGRDDEAIRDLHRAVEFDHYLVAARFNRGAMHFERGQYDAALADFIVCIQEDPESAPPYFNRAVTYEALGQVDSARADLLSFLTLSSNVQWKAMANELLEKWSDSDQAN